jgi:glucose uptake protein GlcU
MLLPIDAVRHILLVPTSGVGVVIIVTGVLDGKTCTQMAGITMPTFIVELPICILVLRCADVIY